jgi:HPt (histidine-containing phosphotransfer) domain-containing protein
LARVQAIVKRLSANFHRTAVKSVAEMRGLVATDWPSGADRLFRLSHDLKGQGATFGFPAVTAIATQLCRDIEARADVNAISAQVEALAKSLS